MKRLTTYYFILLAGLNVLFATYLGGVIVYFKTTLEEILQGKPLPLATEQLLGCYWWPWLFFGVACLGTLLSILGIPHDRFLRHILIGAIFIELVGVFWTVVALSTPWITITQSLGH
jgi:hypothetical protein